MKRRDLLKILGLSPLVPVAVLVEAAEKTAKTPLPEPQVRLQLQEIDQDGLGECDYALNISWDAVPNASHYNWSMSKIRPGGEDLKAEGVTKGTQTKARCHPGTSYTVKVTPVFPNKTISDWSVAGI